MVGNKQLTVLIYVDDILALCENEEAIEELAQNLTEEFGEITMQMDISVESKRGGGGRSAPLD